MQPSLPQYDVGVIIGRFQVHELHQGHRDLIQHVADQHEKVVILLGLAPIPTSTSNPLDFEARKQMLAAAFPDAIILYVKDQPDDEVWSRLVDERVDDVLMGAQSAVIYGGRDSFIAHYSGKFSTQELVQAEHYSGTAVRKRIAKSSTRSSADFRAGVIWASTARFPTAFTTVDIAILHDDGRLLLGRKPNERLYRFIGGFSDPRSPDFETDARREVMEEAGIEVGDVTYLGSRVVDDWRYRNEPDCIKTMLFSAKYLHGRPTPGDDIEEVRWFGLPSSIGPETTSMDGRQIDWRTLVPAHRPLMTMLLNRKESMR